MSKNKITIEEARTRVKNLKTEIDRIRYSYHVLDKEIVSESVKTSLQHELSELEEMFPELLTSDSPTQRVAGKPLSKFGKIVHKHPGLSLNDVFDEDELKKWEERVAKMLGRKPEYYVELKIDGLSVYLTYERGFLKKAATRGDGKVGEDITQNAKAIESIPLRLKRDIDLEVRGEVYMDLKQFQKVNTERSKKEEPIYANPRNLAAGTLRQLDSKIVAERNLKFSAWAVFGEGVETHAQQHDLAVSLGFRVEPHSRFCKNLQQVIGYLEKWEEKRKKLPYQTDGAVVNINSDRDFDELGIVGKAPRGSVAFKFSAEQVTTKVEDIRISVGRTGALTPFAVLKPVRVAGSTISRATLHNEDEIRRKDIRIGDTVVIQKAGDIIPEVVQSMPGLRNGKEKKFEMPEVCPICGSAVEKPKGEAVTRCVSDNCFAIQRERIIHFSSKGAFDIEGLGEKIVDQLIQSGLIEDISDLFALSVGDILPLERFGEISSKKLINAIQSKRKVSFSRFIYSLGIRHVGQITAYDISEHFKNLANLKKSRLEDFLQIDGVGEVVSESIYKWIHNPKNIKLLDKMEERGVEIFEENVGKKLTGMSFVITGTLFAISRDAAEEKIRENGGKASGTVSYRTDYLILGENPGSKYQKAKNLGVKIISEEDFLKLIK